MTGHDHNMSVWNKTSRQIIADTKRRDAQEVPDDTHPYEPCELCGAEDGDHERGCPNEDPNRDYDRAETERGTDGRHF